MVDAMVDKSGLKERKKELLEEIRKLEKEAAPLKSELKRISSEKRDIIGRIQKLNASAESLKAERDALNSKVKEVKKEKEDIKREIDALFVEYKKQKELAPNIPNFRAVEKEISRLEWKLQTSVLNVAKEDEIVKTIAQYKSQIAGSKALSDILKKIDFQKLRLKRVSVKLAKHSAKAQEYHNSFLDVIKEIRKAEDEIEKINKKKSEAEAKLASLEKKIAEDEGEFKEVLAKLGEKDKEKMEKEEDALRRTAVSLYDEFKKGKKLTTDDLYLLQRFRLV